MKGRGAVEMVIAAVVIKLSGHLMTSQTITEPLLTKDQFSALICMSFFTTIIAPLSFKWIVKSLAALMKVQNSVASVKRVERSKLGWFLHCKV
jgi:hypothetical protein